MLDLRILVFVAILVSATAKETDINQIATLIPNIPLNNQTIHPGSDILFYSLTALKPGVRYEIRVSYPASVSPCENKGSLRLCLVDPCSLQT